VWSRHVVLLAACRLWNEAAAPSKELLMNNVFGEPWIIRHTSYFSDPRAESDELLNDATEWLQYAYNAIKLLA